MARAEIEVALPEPIIVGFQNQGLGLRWCNPSPLYDRTRLIQEEA